MAEKTTRVLLMGMGEIGKLWIRGLSSMPMLQLVGVVDKNPSLIGTCLNNHLEETLFGDCRIHPNLESALAQTKADVALLLTGSAIADVQNSVLECLRKKLHVVTAAEELAFPWEFHYPEAEKIFLAAKKARRAVIAAGVNPGLIMDTLPAFLTRWSVAIDKITIERHVDLAQRRENLRRKAGFGLSKKQIEELISQKKIGHVGLSESFFTVANTLEWEPSYEEQVSPIFSPEDSNFVIGLRQTAKGRTKEGRTLELRLILASGERSSDRIEIRGIPEIRVEFPNGLDGDQATVAALLRACELVKKAPQGLTRLADFALA